MALTKAEIAKRWRERHPERAREVNRRWRQKNAEKARADKKTWYANNVEVRKAGARRSALKTKYGITEEEFNAVFAKQKGLCAICGKPEQIQGRKLSVDHCHTFGKVRQLLCDKCNRMLGCAGDDPNILRRAATYLEKHFRSFKKSPSSS